MLLPTLRQVWESLHLFGPWEHDYYRDTLRSSGRGSASAFTVQWPARRGFRLILGSAKLAAFSRTMELQMESMAAGEVSGLADPIR